MAWYDGMEEPRLLIAPLPSNLRKDTNTIANAEGSILSLRHPKSGTPASCILLNGILQQVNWFKQSYGSWFLGDYVCEDCSLYITTKVDPIFILLPIFEDARMKKGNDQGMFRQLDEILYVEGYPGYQNLTSMAENCMQLVCEVKEIGSLKFFRLDDSKVLVWLCHKVRYIKETLIKLDNNYAIQEEKDTLKDIISILGEYLKDEPWLKLLCNHLQLDVVEECIRAPNSGTDPTFIECTPLPSSAIQVEIGNEKQRSSSSGRQSKKMKAEIDSKSIKDMFQRASRRGT